MSTQPPPLIPTPRRIALILPCCIGDAILATATLQALRRAYPEAHIAWLIGSWSRPALDGHDLVDALIDTGPEALPVRSLAGMRRMIRLLRAGHCDLAVSLVRSPLMSAAVWLAGIPARAGLDSGGRGFGYSIRARLDPAVARHEADIYLDVARALGIDVQGCWANVPVHATDQAAVRGLLAARGIGGAYVVINPAGGRNPGMIMDAKRWPPDRFAGLAARLARHFGAQIVLVGGPGDGDLIAAVQARLAAAAVTFVGELTFRQIAALAAAARLYIGNDTGLTHLAAAAGARTAMILGPSDPARYAPFVPDALALWRPVDLPAGGVAAGQALAERWDWDRDGISLAEAETQILAWLAR
ncbi:MAG: glycosyltransferase family 9 protein [Chloroflexi bacterium]|nr:glycosyltransferase family 9 protein [Chloroflexota bacterium]